ncbi:hypothetical protein EWI07_11750 [Sporolactobacillus sp. THM7-4]|nr:hypothetical protein EWI07_11750 [Sporolactobacillus sp. THM7-4]
MRDLIKKGLFIGLGATIAGKEKADKFFSDLSRSGSLFTEETKSIIDHLGEKGKNKNERWRSELREDFAEAIRDLGFVRVEEYEKLKARVEALEAQSVNHSLPEKPEDLSR